jgi:hypothetical protein
MENVKVKKVIQLVIACPPLAEAEILYSPFAFHIIQGKSDIFSKTGTGRIEAMIRNKGVALFF